MTDDAARTKARSVRASLFSAHAFAPRQSTSPAEGQLADRHQLRRVLQAPFAPNMAQVSPGRSSQEKPRMSSGWPSPAEEVLDLEDELV
jgi:hypothetical protein